jgi:hypothetical protein
VVLYFYKGGTESFTQSEAVSTGAGRTEDD